MVKLGHSGSFRVRVGVKTSLITDTETVLMAPPSSLDGTVAGKVPYQCFLSFLYVDMLFFSK